MFVKVPASRSGVLFANNLNETYEVNWFTYEYMYNGAGVAIGDLNADGLPDIYFAGNQVPDKLYLNQGGLQFNDITDKAMPPRKEGWQTGVTMADVNNDGLLDIYVCRAGHWNDPKKRTNLLFINKGSDAHGIPRFAEEGELWGVADTTRSTQGAFFDFDHDGDLDLYVLNYPLQRHLSWSTKQTEELIGAFKSPSQRLYRNDGDHFVDITRQAGIWSMGYGLGVAISDFNGDGQSDIYAAYDYAEPDRMYLGDGRGRFHDELTARTRHISYFSMGCDAADYNNDGLVDLIVVDMASEDHIRSKKNMSGMDPSTFWMAVKAGYHYQYMFNTLQVNNGNGTFSDLGQLAGISKTDWSWSPLFADLDNDGWKDLLVTNGYRRDTRDNDFNKNNERQGQDRKKMSVDEFLALIPTSKLRDYLYQNNGDLTFSNVTEEWGFREAANSNGAAYADLDLDGDLDLIINRQDEPSVIYENHAVQQGHSNYLRIALEGAGGAMAMGAKVTVTTSDGIQYQELMPTRGFASCMESVLHFGLGAQDLAIKVEVVWPDGLVSTLLDVPSGQVLAIQKAGAVHPNASTSQRPLFTESSRSLGLDFRHVENVYDDFAYEVLLPHKQSENGPLLSVGDANGDGLEDLFVGGARDQSGALFIQTPSGRFMRAASQPWALQKASEDLGSLFFDADGDGDQDLIIISGSNEVNLHFELYNSRIYLNNGTGSFNYAPNALPAMQTSGMRVASGDFDADGDQDLFIGGRVTPGQYPKAPRSYLLANNGNGIFSDVTAQAAPDLMYPGLVTDAELVDYDGDKDLDLILVGEWMPVSFFENLGGRFVSAIEKSGLADTEGWWWSITSGDVDGDGDIDLLCGNIGWNTKFHATPDRPLHVYWNDFDGNGHPDIVLANENRELGLVPVRGRECSSQQCPMILDKFPTYDSFARASIEQIYSPEKIGKALHLEAKQMLSCILINEGHGRFTMKALPYPAQTAPIMGALFMDVNSDGKADLIVAGNHWGAEVETERYDAGTGLVLLGNGHGDFTPMTIAQSGFFAWGNVKDLAAIHIGKQRNTLIVVANNNDPLQAYLMATSQKIPAGMSLDPLSLK